MTDGLQTMTVGIHDERSVVTGTILSAKSRLAIGCSAVSDGRMEECIHAGSSLRGQGEVKSRTGGNEARSLFDREPIVASGRAVSDRIGKRPNAHDGERCKRSVVERSRTPEICRAER